MSKTYSAGIVTAYGAAKRAGYQGTYEDFCRQQAGYAESAATVEQAKNTAVSAASTATTKAGEAATAATAAQTAKTQTEAAASQALTDIGTARTAAISAVQTEGQTQTANARAQAQAAAQSATTASTKASEASASATSAGRSATNAAASATNAASSASAAQGVLESIPSDYSQMSADVTQLKADLDAYLYGFDESFTVTANLTNRFSIPFIKGKTYTITNNTTAACAMNAVKKDGTLTNLSNNMLAGASLSFTPDTDDYIAIKGWINGTGTIRVQCDYSDIDAVDSKASQDYVDTAIIGTSKTFNITAANASTRFFTPLVKNVQYTYTNNTSAGLSLNLYRADGTYTRISAGLNKNASIDFIPDSNEYVAIGGYFQGTGTVTLTSVGLNVQVTKNTKGVTANKAEVILGNLGTPVIDKVNRQLSWNQTLYINTVNGRYAITTSEAASQLNTYASLSDSTIIVTIPTENDLVYRVSEGSLKVIGRNSVEADDIILFGEYYQNDYGLLWDKYWRDKIVYNYGSGFIRATDIFNAEPYEGTYDWQTPVVNYGKLFKGKAIVEAFAFFTDPHVMGFADSNRNETKMANYLKRVQKVYNATPCSFIVSGGDWLNNSTTMDEACYRLGYLKGIATHLLDGCKLVIGNHDMNYQGKETASSDNYTGTLTNETVASILFRDTDTKKAYYSFDGSNSKCYVLDTGIEHSTMLTYDWEQVSWLAEKLVSDDPEHAIIFLHIITSSGSVQTNANTFGTLVGAYNSHTTITLNSVTYDFSSCTGHVDFWVAGHTHVDGTGTLGGIPYFITASNSSASDVPLIDLVLVDYDNRTVNLVRVGGTGSDRTISIA